MGRLIAGIVGLLMVAGGGYLVILWWDGNAALRFISGFICAGGLGVLWTTIKGEGGKKPSKDSDK